MRTLRITQSAEHAGHSHVTLRLEIPNQPPKEPPAIDLKFDFTLQDQEDLRWYLEDYLQYPLEPAPTIAARIESRLAEIGQTLFTSLFHNSDDARDLYAQLRDHLPDTRIEIITSVHEAASIPWELLRDPKTDSPLALHAHSFVRTLPNPALSQFLPEPTPGPIRILLVICRPNADEDVPFRSVAAYILKGLTDDARANFQLEVLRPPTFEQLSKTLRAAHANNTPYHAVHFDGHGTYLESPDTKLSDLLKQFSALLLTGPREGAHGYLAFENPAVPENVQLVDGPTLGRLLAETRVPVLLLNSCRSAYADPPTQPQQASPNPDHPDPHTQIRAFGTLAQEIIHEGVAAVLAMRYNLYVVTAAQFVADLYAALAQGHSLGQAVTLGRKQLAAQPLREIAFDPIPLQDWPVPVIYEAVPLSLFPKLPSPDQLILTLTTKPTPTSQAEINLPPRPDIGFFGRDETLLALDRAFDTQSIVLLHAFAGAGKTTTAAEFARWYALTGGLHGPILFTSFQHHLTLPRVLDTLGTVFNDALEQSNIHWLTLTDPQRRHLALQILNQIPLLWIWDNIEPIAGLPAGSKSLWTDPEQQELLDFLRSAAQTKSKFLLTSRRDERAFLGNLPAPIKIPPMPLQERVQLARALAKRHSNRTIDVSAWRPLLSYTQGNPLTITVLVGQALRDNLTTKDQIESFVAKLRAGQSAFTDDESQGRSQSLGASLSYGFDSAFIEAERKQLALLHFFQGFVDVDALRTMGDPKADWCLPELRGRLLQRRLAYANQLRRGTIPPAGGPDKPHRPRRDHVRSEDECRDRDRHQPVHDGGSPRRHHDGDGDRQTGARAAERQGP